MFEKLFGKIMLFVTLIGICGCLFVADGMTASAAENDYPYSYYINRYYKNGSVSYFSIDSPLPFAGFPSVQTGYEGSYLFLCLGSASCVRHIRSYDALDGSFNDREDIYIYREQQSGQFIFDSNYETSYSTNIPIFDSRASALNYLKTGDETGMIIKPQPETPPGHDFSKDTYNPDIPVPKLSNISHHGFTLSNYEDGYYVDLIVENKLYGVKWENIQNKPILGVTLPSFKWQTVLDKNWVYSSNYWEMAHETEVAVGKANIDIKSDFGVDVEGKLFEDWQKWSAEYPHENKLPTFNALHALNDNRYILKFTMHGDTLQEKRNYLNASGLASTTYYVRYFDKDMNYGKWRYYRYSDDGVSGSGEISQGGTVVGGDVNVDDNGNVSFDDTDKDKVDSWGDGSLYDPFEGMNEYDSSLQGFKETLYTFMEAISVVPNFIAKAFSFLPSWCIGLLGLAVSVIVIIRFLGR